jgi:hypothetical protein
MTLSVRPGDSVSTTPFGAFHPRAGLSLLEVLVACGILVVGLSSIAALLPAAGSRFAQATQSDRASVTAANAYAEIVARGLSSATDGFTGTMPVVFGKGFTDTTTGKEFNSITNIAKGIALSGIDPIRGYYLQDDLVYLPPRNAETPVNSFEPGNATPPIRRYNNGVCWGAMVSPANTFDEGAAATLSIAVFRKDGEPPKAISLTGASGMFKMATPNESDLKRYLSGCSYVLALPSGSAARPRWFRIASSWKQENSADCWVGFEDHERFVKFAGSAPTVVGFEHLMRVDHYPVTLE